MNPLHLLNRIEMNSLFRWETIVEVGEDFGGLTDEDQDIIHRELEYFVDIVLPQSHTERWAMWTDGSEIFTKSKEIASRMATVVDAFAHRIMGYRDAEGNEADETDDLAGYWYVTWI